MAEKETDALVVVCTSGEAAHIAGVTVQTIRTWHARGRLRTVAMTTTGTRLFDPGEVRRVGDDQRAKRRANAAA